MGRSVEEVEGQCRFRGDLGHDVEGEGRRKVDPSGRSGRFAPEGHNQSRGPGKGVLIHLVEEDCACNPGEHTVAVGKGTLKIYDSIILLSTSLSLIISNYKSK